MKNISIIATGDSFITMAMTRKVERWVPELDNNGKPTGLQILITMRQSAHSEPRFLEMVQMIRGADVAFTNLEMLLHHYEGYPAAECGGTYTRADPEMIEELKWMGFDIVSTANNHSLDYMYGGLIATLEHLNNSGVPHAGTGLDLSEARQPTYLETPRGRVALVAAASTFASFGWAGAARRDMHGRPGLNPLRYETHYVVSEETLETLKGVAEEMGLAEVAQPEDGYYFLHRRFVVGENPGIHTEPHVGDMEGNLEAVREASRQADLVLFSLHAHEGREGDDERPAEFIEEFAWACIDAGAHALFAHGHHALRGIEVRDGRPIFYSLGNFIFQNETVTKMPSDFYERYGLNPYSGTPADAYDARQKAPPRPGYPARKWFTDDEKYWFSVIPSMTFQGENLAEMKLHPIDLGYGRPRPQRGHPMLAEPELAERILGTMQRLSKPYGTEITVENGVGIIEL